MPKVSEAHVAERRRQIIEAAQRCFARNGFHQSSMQDIVRESNLSPGAIYGYFASKEEIVAAIARHRHRRERELMGAVREEATGLEALRGLARRFIGSLELPEERQERRLGVQVWAEALRNPALLRVVREGLEQPQAALAETYRSARERGELPDAVDPDAAARLTIALFHGILLQKAWNPRLDTAALLEVLDLLLGALEENARAARPATSRPAKRRAAARSRRSSPRPASTPR
jgi:AcrR family transcriptional regulator